MQVEKSNRFLRTVKKIKDHLLNTKIKEAIELLENDHKHNSLHFKKINCKKDKFRHSIRVPGTKYRILMSAYEDRADLHCICDHNEYDRINKNC